MRLNMITIKGKLLDRGFETPFCGDMYYIVIMRYKVLEVIDGDYRHSFFLAGHGCPEQREKDFEIGGLHLLDLDSTFPDGGCIVNKFEDEAEELGFYYCTNFTVVNQG